MQSFLATASVTFAAKGLWRMRTLLSAALRPSAATLSHVPMLLDLF